MPMTSLPAYQRRDSVSKTITLSRDAGMSFVDGSHAEYLQGSAESLSPISQLPVEILSHVFSYLAANWTPNPGDDDRRKLGWIRITHVCRHWRSVAISHACLWTNIDCKLGSRWAKEMMLRAKSAPVSLSLELVDDSSSLRALSEDDAVFFLQHAHHLTSLTLLGRAASISRALHILTGPAPMLLTIMVAPSDDRHVDLLPQDFLASQAPNLRFATFCGCTAPWLSPIFQNLIHLYIALPGFVLSSESRSVARSQTDPELVQIVETLRMASALESLHLFLGHASHTELETNSLKDVASLSLPHLNHFELSAETFVCAQLIEKIKIPASAALVINPLPDYVTETPPTALIPVLSDHVARSVAQGTPLDELSIDDGQCLSVRASSMGKSSAALFTFTLDFYDVDEELNWLACFFERMPSGFVRRLTLRTKVYEFVNWENAFHQASLNRVESLDIKDLAALSLLGVLSVDNNSPSTTEPGILTSLSTIIISDIGLIGTSKATQTSACEQITKILKGHRSWRVPLRQVAIRRDYSQHSEWLSGLLTPIVPHVVQYLDGEEGCW